MPKGYWIAHVAVRDPEGYQKYVKANGVAFAKYGARFLVRGGKRDVAVGPARARTVVIEFRDSETAIACHAVPINLRSGPRPVGSVWHSMHVSAPPRKAVWPDCALPLGSCAPAGSVPRPRAN